MMTAFEHRVYNFHNGHPVVTEDFATSLVEFFGGGHTPEIRDALLKLRKASGDVREVPSIADITYDPMLFSYVFENENVNVTSDFAKVLAEFFAGGHTPEIRNQILMLQRAAENTEQVN